MAAALDFDRDVAILADVWIDDREDDRILGDVGHGVGEQQRSGDHVERWNQMRQVDDRALRRDPV